MFLARVGVESMLRRFIRIKIKNKMLNVETSADSGANTGRGGRLERLAMLPAVNAGVGGGGGGPVTTTTCAYSEIRVR